MSEATGITCFAKLFLRTFVDQIEYVARVSA